MGVFERLGVKVLGTQIRTLEVSEDRDLFCKALAGPFSTIRLLSTRLLMLPSRNRHPGRQLDRRLDRQRRSRRRRAHRLPRHPPLGLLPGRTRIRLCRERGRAPRSFRQESQSQPPGPHREESQGLEGARVRGRPRRRRQRHHLLQHGGTLFARGLGRGGRQLTKLFSTQNFDPLGIHTGDSIVIAPSQTLSDVRFAMVSTTLVFWS